MDQLLVSIRPFDKMLYHGLYITAPMDYAVGPYTVTILARETRVTFSILISNDTILDGNETFTIIIDPSSLPDDCIVDAVVMITDDHRK